MLSALEGLDLVSTSFQPAILPVALALVPGVGFVAPRVTYFLGKETLVVSDKPGMARWRKGLFSFLSHNALEPTAFFRLPAGQVVEFGGRSEV